jgi:uncharacterized membrane protein
MKSRTTVDVAVLTVLVVLITFVVILTMDKNRTKNLVECIILLAGLLAFAALLLYTPARKTKGKKSAEKLTIPLNTDEEKAA